MSALNPVATVGAQLADVFEVHRPAMSRAERTAAVVELLEIVKVGGARIKSYPHELSGGMRQRIMIAMALALRPQLVVMDEPTTALDVLVQREILREITGLREAFGFSVVFITHDLPLLLEISDRIAVMLRGEIVELDTADRLYREATHPYTRRLLGSFPSLSGERGDFIRTGVLDDEGATA
jgi:peptide/nickel transport system ATP-binding protein